MSGFRNEIRAILREELATMKAESQVVVETVQIGTSSELNQFVTKLVARAASKDFVKRVDSGQLKFELMQSVTATSTVANAMQASSLVASPAPRTSLTFNKNLITERDIATLGVNARSLNICKESRLTPLARDEANRKGIRIVRIEL